MQPAGHRNCNQAMPFASCYEPAPATAPPPTAAAAGQPHQQQQQNCIMRAVEGQLDPQIDISMLHQAGFKTRQSASCIPDLILTTPTLPAPLAIMLATSSDPGHSLDSPAFLQRCASMASTFRLCAVALPHILGAHPAVLQLACAPQYKGKIQVHYMCPGDSPTNTVLQLVASSSNSPQELADDVWNTVVAAATDAVAVNACVAALTTAVR